LYNVEKIARIPFILADKDSNGRSKASMNSIRTEKEKQDLFFAIFKDNYKIKQIQAQHINGAWTRASQQDLFETPNLLKRIAINNSSFKNAFIVDCDHEDYFAWLGVPNLPQPTYTIKNKSNDKHHHVWLLENPIPLIGKENRQILKDSSLHYIKNIQDGLTLALNGDTCYVGSMSKNPLNTELFEVILWDSSMPFYSLADLKAVAVKGINKNRLHHKNINEEVASHGRNSRIFELTRLSAYPIAHRYIGDPEGLLYAIEEIALAYNEQEDEPLPGKEVYQIAKYIREGKVRNSTRKILMPEEKKANRINGQRKRRKREIEEIEKKYRFYTILTLASYFYKCKKQAKLRTIENSGYLYEYKSTPSSKCLFLQRRRQPEEKEEALRSLCFQNEVYYPPPDYLDELMNSMSDKELEQLRYEADLAFP
jgi:hypothetical protein